MKAPPVLEPDELEKLVLTRGLLTCCKMDILNCQLESFAHQVGELEPTGGGFGDPLAWGWQPLGGSVDPTGCTAPHQQLHTSHRAWRVSQEPAFFKDSSWGAEKPGGAKSSSS